MNTDRKKEENRRMATTVENRVGIGPTEIVTGWQNFVTDVLRRPQPFI